MRRVASTLLLLLVLSLTAFAQNSSSSTTSNNPSGGSTASAPKRTIFRATKDQIRQAQAILKERGLYSGEITGKLDDSTRAALKEYQKAEGLKATGTLNRVTLEKMSIVLTDRQKTIS